MEKRGPMFTVVLCLTLLLPEILIPIERHQMVRGDQVLKGKNQETSTKKNQFGQT